VAVVLGFQEHDIARLVVAKLLTPLGKPAHNSGVPPFFVPGAMRDLVVLLGFDCCLAELRP
jgi:hypothetical protein